MCTHVHVYTYVCLHIPIYIHTVGKKYVYICVYIYMYIHICICILPLGVVQYITADHYISGIGLSMFSGVGSAARLAALLGERESYTTVVKSLCVCEFSLQGS